MNLTKNSQNQEIINELGSKLDKGNPVVYAITDSSTEEQKILWIIQQREGTNAVQIMQGINSYRRSFMPVKSSVLKQKGYRVGSQLKGFDITVEESFEPFYDNQDCVINPSNMEVVPTRYNEDTETMECFYRTTSLQLEGTPDALLPREPESAKITQAVQELHKEEVA